MCVLPMYYYVNNIINNLFNCEGSIYYKYYINYKFYTHE